MLRAALARHKLTLNEVERHGIDVSANAASTSAAVLRLKAQGITHMFNANLLFYQGAGSQRLHPRYAVDDTIDTPQLLAQNVGKEQLHGAMGAGYQPLNEVENFGSVGPAADQCIALDAGRRAEDRGAVHARRDGSASATSSTCSPPPIRGGGSAHAGGVRRGAQRPRRLLRVGRHLLDDVRPSLGTTAPAACATSCTTIQL